ncbi:unnamed protein product [Dimorphilus gyrociliatus]|uniref:Uncharacterized protein n=1 Tax=Dimorphilus gyrociliatus TaxID=2664684 RepID=A0A7I8VAQ8_9ANNE|nr:unnamed protein product [Dimorphilus gyrociliatus]
MEKFSKIQLTAMTALIMYDKDPMRIFIRPLELWKEYRNLAIFRMPTYRPYRLIPNFKSYWLKWTEEQFFWEEIDESMMKHIICQSVLKSGSRNLLVDGKCGKREDEASKKLQDLFVEGEIVEYYDNWKDFPSYYDQFKKDLQELLNIDFILCQYTKYISIHE